MAATQTDQTRGGKTETWDQYMIIEYRLMTNTVHLSACLAKEEHISISLEPEDIYIVPKPAVVFVAEKKLTETS